MPLVVAVEEANVAGGFTKVNVNVALIKASEGKIIFFYLLALRTGVCLLPGMAVDLFSVAYQCTE